MRARHGVITFAKWFSFRKLLHPAMSCRIYSDIESGGLITWMEKIELCRAAYKLNGATSEYAR